MGLRPLAAVTLARGLRGGEVVEVVDGYEKNGKRTQGRKVREGASRLTSLRFLGAFAMRLA